MSLTDKELARMIRAISREVAWEVHYEGIEEHEHKYHTKAKA